MLMAENLDKYANAYNDDFKYALDNDIIIRAYAKRIAGKLTGNSLLELGIGHGFSTEIFSERVERYLIVEGSKEIIDRFSAKNPRNGMEIAHSLFEDFSTDEKFDNIVMGFVLEHVEDPEAIVAKYGAFLKKDGRLFITVPNSEALNRRLGFSAGMIDSLDFLSEYDRMLGHKRYFNMNSLETLARGAGFKILSAEGLFLKPITTDQIKEIGLKREILDAMIEVGYGYPELCTAILMELAHEE